MRNQIKYIAFVGLISLTGCFNMPTPTANITGAYNSGLYYDQASCSRLTSELALASKEETQLILAQENRIKNSKIQSIFLGFGQGDSIEASKLANVRGEKEAIKKAINNKNCK